MPFWRTSFFPLVGQQNSFAWFEIFFWGFHYFAKDVKRARHTRFSRVARIIIIQDNKLINSNSIRNKRETTQTEKSNL